MVGSSRKLQGAGIQRALAEGIGRETGQKGISEKTKKKTETVPPLIEKQVKEEKAQKNGKWSHNGIDLTAANDRDWAQDTICVN